MGRYLSTDRLQLVLGHNPVDPAGKNIDRATLCIFKLDDSSLHCVSISRLSCCSSALQVRDLFGSDGLSPMGNRFARMRADYPTWKRFIYMPSLWWVCSADWFMTAAAVAATVCSLGLVIGVGPVFTPLCLIICIWFYISLDASFPWDKLLIEASYLALFLPVPLPLISIGATGLVSAPIWSQPSLSSLALSGLPSAVQTFAFRWLLFRLMFGFGKTKFVGCHLYDDRLYVKNFFMSMPMPNVIGWWAYHAPGLVHAINLLVMFVVRLSLVCFPN